MIKSISSMMAVLCLAACSPKDISGGVYGQHARIADNSQTEQLLQSLPAPKRRPVVSVYDYRDLTGQHKPSDNVAEYSRAVTQGGAQILIKALMEAGNGRWFQVIERNSLENLLQERKIIRATRQEYTTDTGRKLPDLPPLLYAGLMIEGGIVAYESNVLTGGAGARYLGIGGNSEYRRDMVTVYLRATSVSNGEILLAANTSKTIYSTLVQGGVFKYVGVDELLEIESGFSVNEPPQYATRQAIEMAVYSLIMEGAIKGYWEFENQAAGAQALAQYKRFKHKDVDLDALLSAQAPPRDSHPAPDASNAAPIINKPEVQSEEPYADSSTLEQLPSAAEPVKDSEGRTRDIEAPLLDASRYYRRRPNRDGVFSNDLYCDAEGCFPIRPIN